jgi:hypothetical protein
MSFLWGLMARANMIFSANIPWEGKEDTSDWPLGRQLAWILEQYIFPFALLGGVAWAIWLAVQFSKAKDEGSRRAVKARLVKMVASIAIILACWAILAATKKL